jgi:peptide/nickel transport system substrate-binding protein
MHVLARVSKIMLATALLVTLGACTRSCSDKSDTDNAIKLVVALPIEGLDPRFTTSATAQRVAKLVYAPLFEFDEDSIPQPFLAQKIETLDEKSFKITLKDKLFFHDGSPISAHDVEYTFSTLGSPDVLSPHAEKFLYVKSIRAENDKEIIFELKSVHAPFLTDLCALGVVSKKACENRSQKCRHEYLGSGPYKVKEWNQAKESIFLEPFAQWMEGAPLSPIHVRVVRDENTRLLELIGKKADLVESDVSPQNIAEIKKHDYLAIESSPGLGYSYLAINVRGPRPTDQKGSDAYTSHLALADKRVRKAIAHAINFDEIIEKVLLGTAKRTSGLIPNGHWAKDNNLQVPNFDTALAEKLLDEAGFVRKGNDQSRFSLVISTTSNRLRQSIAQLYVDYLQRVGIKASLRVKDWSALFQDMKEGNFDVFSADWVPVSDPDLYYWVHHSSNIPAENHEGGNRHGFKNSEIDKLIELGRVSIDQQKRKMIYQEIERLMMDELPYIPLWNIDRLSIINVRLKNYKPVPSGSLLGLRHASVGAKRAEI